MLAKDNLDPNTPKLFRASGSKACILQLHPNAQISQTKNFSSGHAPNWKLFKTKTRFETINSGYLKLDPDFLPKVAQIHLKCL